jgi:diguanylate cyclase (GGDEF)-like protein
VFYVALYDAKTSTVDHGIFYEGDVWQLIEPCSIAAAPGISGAVILERRTIYLPDASLPEVHEKYQLIHRSGPPSRSYVGVPLILLDQVVGVISMQSYKPYAYTAEQVRLLETIATQAAIAVQNARLYEQMRQMAITDTVTELFTRRHFTALGHNEVERALRYNRTLSVLMVDIDRFKKVNDTYGHSAGDQVLLSVAKICLQALRQTDIVGRWGGEEFTIVLPEADRDGAVMIAERIRRIVEETVISLTPQIGICLTVSIGVATLCPECSNLEDLVDCADRALYIAKQSGRNRVKVGEG